MNSSLITSTFSFALSLPGRRHAAFQGMTSWCYYILTSWRLDTPLVSMTPSRHDVFTSWRGDVMTWHETLWRHDVPLTSKRRDMSWRDVMRIELYFDHVTRSQLNTRTDHFIANHAATQPYNIILSLTTYSDIHVSLLIILSSIAHDISRSERDTTLYNIASRPRHYIAWCLYRYTLPDTVHVIKWRSEPASVYVSIATDDTTASCFLLSAYSHWLFSISANILKHNIIIGIFWISLNVKPLVILT